MINPKEFIKALKSLEESKNIPQDVVIEALKQAFINTYQKENGKDALCRVEISEKKGKIEMWNQKKVVEEVVDDFLEVSLDDARVVNPDIQIGDIFEIPINTDEFDRMAALHVRQILKQKLREAEKQVIYDEYINKKDDIIIGVVDRVEANYTLINIGKTNALLPVANKIPNEEYYSGEHIKVYVMDVDKSSQGAQVIVSRNAPGFLKRLFESEIMEIYDGTVEIRSIAREPGERAKVAVSSRNDNVDAPGACIGQKGMRIQKITSQLSNEKIDVIQYYDEPELYIAEALKPANVYGIALNADSHAAIAIVPNEEFSLAIGKKGQNARLAVKLTTWKIDIKTVDDAMEAKINYETMADIKKRYKNLAAPVVEVVAPIKEEPTIEIIPVAAAKPVEVAPVVVEEPAPTPVVAEPIVETPVVEDSGKTKTTKKAKEVEISIPTEIYIPKVEQELEEQKAREKAELERASRRRRSFEDKPVDAKPTTPNSNVNYMPVYTDEELKELEAAEKQKPDHSSKYEEEIDYDEFDSYYEDK